MIPISHRSEVQSPALVAFLESVPSGFCPNALSEKMINKKSVKTVFILVILPCKILIPRQHKTLFPVPPKPRTTCFERGPYKAESLFIFPGCTVEITLDFWKNMN